MKVLTIDGEIEFSELRVEDVVELGDNHRKIMTRYYRGDKLVREDGVVNFLRPFDGKSEQGKIGG